MAVMDLLIEKINDLQDICTENNISNRIELPQIVVVGSQSSGKSSVLENIVGRDILPRGTGIVTRRPLILQLIYSKTEDYAVFNHLPETKFTNFEEVKKEIIKETNRILKSKNDVSPLPITLKYYSSKVLTLTLVDLPGLVRVPTNDQPKDICTKITEICRKYVSNRNALILAVSSANTDISNSDALQLAREVDHNYERTIGVLTKVDLMDSGTDVVDILAGRIICLRLGFVPVVNRSQQDIERNKSIQQALKDEEVFFLSHESYKRNRAYCGTGYLITKLHNILHEHIKQCLPELQERINSGMIDAQNNLRDLGNICLSPKENVMRIINTVSKRFSDILSGNIESKGNELMGGARLNYAFNHHFSKFINRLGALDNIHDEQIRALLYNSSGSSSVLLFGHVAFEKLARVSVESFKLHSLKLVSIVFSELVRMIKHIVDVSTASRYPVLGERIIACAIGMFKERCDATHKLVESFVDWNTGYISTRHPDFIRWNEMLSREMEDSVLERKAEKIDFYKGMESKATLDSIPNTLRIRDGLSEQEVIEINMIKSMVESYFEITKKIIVDQVPKAIMCELVKKAENSLQETLFMEIYNREDLDSIASESEEVKLERSRIESMLKALKQAYDIICSL
ncbi:dynamin-like vacuolar protein sorting protein [Encephalitozoon intestinalis ATCC 50506]|uniref:Dynamin-like vacuolar protein sorting protein n=1 Tax=Encephalitozoon intestinalis (strain ATCC 50506) TaxID=876142 RepID=E0S9V7_ENCIT|nr:dynamin-like vacuolar protein sorting protein [Encephalitozoon intestinalis ATCC 50506]ADM12492.1 dynamin-like vacuolar protein sorting protein [Encephalitozoon intestinalis ATCC 50506]UTX46329.1 dynamin [Encephalitozoon intestinalis]